MPDQFAAVDELARAFQGGGGQPGFAYGIVAGGQLVHGGGCGERWLGGRTPDVTSVFRIASMTKSFTAAAVLALRDEGRLALDDPAAAYLPELRGLRLPTADSPPVSIRYLLTMTAGFPTDDPWGDRQQGLPLDSFAGLLAAGPSFAWVPGTRFEYSNLGYAILGRIISTVAQMSYPAFVTARLLRPLGMNRTGFDAGQFDVMDLARGYRRGPGRWEEIVPDPTGAFAPMGGVFSCVQDLARWVSGFTAAFPPGEPAAGGPHPLARATRREMQLPQALLAPPGAGRLPGDPAEGSLLGYGFGLFVDEHPRGRVVGHSGGYPGFGSNMRWHLGTGLAVIVLANSTYAAAPVLAGQMLDAVLRQQAPAPAGDGGPAVVAAAGAPGGPWPATLAAQREVTKLLDGWTDAQADRLFSPNVAQDLPYPERRHRIELLRQRAGRLEVATDRPAEFDSPAHCRWWLAGERAVVQAEIRLTPEPAPRVQSFTLAVPPAPDGPLGQVVTALIALLNGGAPDWPPALPVTGSVVTAVLLRQLRMAAAWAGPCRPGAFRAGNGETSTTVELDGETGRLLLTATVSPDGQLRQADILIRP